MKKIIILSIIVLSLNVSANSYLQNNEIRSFLEKQESLDAKDINFVMDIINKQKFGFKTLLYSDGFNAGCFYDKKTWDLEVKMSNNSKFPFPDGPKVYLVELSNYGISCDITYQWVFIFMTEEMNPTNIPGSIFRGYGAGLQFGGGLQTSWLNGENNNGKILYLSPRWGFGGGVYRPKMIFKKIEELD